MEHARSNERVAKISSIHIKVTDSNLWQNKFCIDV